MSVRWVGERRTHTMPPPSCMWLALLATLVAAQGAREGQPRNTADVTTSLTSSLSTSWSTDLTMNLTASLTRSPSTSWSTDLTMNLTTILTRSPSTSWSTDLLTSSATKPTSSLATTTTTTPATNLLCPGSLLMEPAGTMSWEVGTVNNVTCFVSDHSSSLTARDLIMFRGDTSLPRQVTDNYTILVTLDASQPTKYHVTCTDSNYTNFCLGEVIVGYPPLDVEDFSCVSYNWNSLRCRWTIPDNPAQLNSQDYKPYLITTTTADGELNGECACEYLEGGGEPCDCPKSCCTWLPPQYASVDEYLYVVFKTENNLGRGSFRHNISNYAVVLPDEALHVEVEPTARSRILRVTWVLPSPMEVFASLDCVVYRVDHRLAAPAHPNSTWLTRNHGKCCSENCKTEAEVEVDHWWQEYEVRVRLRSGAAPDTLEEDGWWSAWSPTFVTTPPAAPETAPPVGPGTYQVSEHYLIVAWRPIPPLLHNGPDFFYQVTATSDDLGGMVVEPAEVKDSFATFLNLDSFATYRVEVVAVNSQGRSNVTSVVLVEAASSLPAGPVLPVVVQHSHIYELRWNNEDPAARSYTVYLCTDGQDEQTPCTTNLYWTSVGNVSAVNMTLADWDLTEEGSSGVRFAVSAESSSGASSGMSWDRCGRPRPYQTTRNPPSLSRPTDLQKTSALVPWTLECNDRAAVVEAVEAWYCSGSHNLTSQCPGKNMTSEVLVGDVQLTGLQEATQYTVWLRLHYRSGLSQWSSGQTFVTLDRSGLAAWVIGVITVGAVISAVVIILFLGYSRSWLANIKRELERDVNLPDGLLTTDPKPLPAADDLGQDASNLRPQPTIPAHAKDHALTPNKSSTLRSALAQVTEGKLEVAGGRGLSQGGRLLPLGEEEDNCINQATEWANAAFINSGDGSSRSPGTASSIVVLRQDSTPNYSDFVVPSFPSDYDFGSVKDGTTSKDASDVSYSSCVSPSPRYVAVQPHYFTSSGNNGYISPDMTIRINPREAIKDDAEVTKTEESSLDQVTPGTGYVAVQPPDFGTHTINSYVLLDVKKYDPLGEGQASEAAPAPETTQSVRDTTSVATSGGYEAVEFLETGGGAGPLQDLAPSPAPADLGVTVDAGFKPVEGTHLYVPDTLPNMKADVNPLSSHTIVNEVAEVGDEVLPVLPRAAPSQGYVAIQPPDFGILGECVHETTVRTSEVTLGKEKYNEDRDENITDSISKSSSLYDAVPSELGSNVYVISPALRSASQALDIPVPSENSSRRQAAGDPGAGCSVPGQAVGGAATSLDAAPLHLVGSFLKRTASPAATDYIHLDHLIHDNRFEVPEPHNEKEIESMNLEYGDEIQEGQEESLRRESLASEDLPLGYSRVGEASVKSSIL